MEVRVGPYLPDDPEDRILTADVRWSDVNEDWKPRLWSKLQGSRDRPQCKVQLNVDQDNMGAATPDWSTVLRHKEAESESSRPKCRRLPDPTFEKSRGPESPL